MGYTPGDSDRFGDRPARPANAPAYPPPGEGRTARPAATAALPVGVRDGDVLIVGVGAEIFDDVAARYRTMIREACGVDVQVVITAAASGVTVLRPEASA